MGVLILTAPVAAGKNTISQLLAQKRQKCAVIDVDLVRWMFIQPHKAPWDGEEGKIQQKLGVKNAIILTKNFVEKGADVVVLDVLKDDTAKLYREALPEAKIVLLMPSYDEAYKRFLNKPQTISDAEFKMVYEWQENLTIYDNKIDNTFLSAEETAEKLNSFF